MKTLIKIFLLLTLINSKAEVNDLSSDELIAAQKSGIVIIDIRTPEEWHDVGIIPNSTKIMFFDQNRKPLINEFMSEFEKIVTHKDQPFVLVCRSGSRTGVVTKYLDDKLGYTHASHLAKGIKQWIAENHQVEK